MNKSTEVKSSKIKTLIIENHEVTAIGTKQILESQCPYLKPIGIALNAEEARELVNDEPEFIIMDIMLGTIQNPNINGIELANEFGKKYSKNKIILYSGYNNGYITRLFKTENINGYILKESPVERFISAVKSIHSGIDWVLDKDVIPRDTNIILRFISETQNEVLYLTACGFFGKRSGKRLEIAEIMIIEPATVGTHHCKISASLEASGIQDTIEKFAEKLYPFPEPRDIEIFKKILNYWRELESSLGDSDPDNKAKAIDIFRRAEPHDLLEIISDSEKLSQKTNSLNKDTSGPKKDDLLLSIKKLIHSKSAENLVKSAEILRELGNLYKQSEGDEYTNNELQKKKGNIKKSRNKKERIKKCYVSALFLYKYLIIKIDDKDIDDKKFENNIKKNEYIKTTFLLHEKLGDVFKSLGDNINAERQFKAAQNINEKLFPIRSSVREENLKRLEKKINNH